MKFKINSDIIFVLILSIFIITLIILPGMNQKKDYIYYKAEVVETINDEVFQYGLVKQGSQNVSFRILNKDLKGEEFSVYNDLIGKMELDKFVQPGDKVLVERFKNQFNDNFRIVDFYRFNSEILLFSIFAIILILISGWTGLKSLLSFMSTILVIWKIMIPMFLNGGNPVIIAFFIVSLLTFIIIFLVAGFNKKGFVAFIGAISGVLITVVLSLSFAKPFYINGAVKPFSETLLYSGYANLDLNLLFISGIFLASSGAVMDIAMDISASMYEVKMKKDDISTFDLMKSGLNVGRAVIGTMTTTLLLAYSGGFATLLMAFMAQGVNEMALLNINYISSEILNIIVGSFGLVLTAPLTAFLGSIIINHEFIKENKSLKSLFQKEEL
ncbi:YibE/F family protein [Geotoga petraea]|jgi:uncharacterized membrane protein|uniref:YibE/F family protein n=1 Tax=Geotoga petraea TaxID=28234 RepID=A0A1G6P822_9BACT|nr:YibE/F family protein [Geotoga petraea]TGG87932.1 YibE/F family protein [Geotoga petraea]SDC76138.1 Uncharacterized membrane protein [Geotoga petraea]